MEDELKKIFIDNYIEIKGIGSYECIDSNGMTLLRIRELLLSRYNIVVENIEKQYYICSIKLGTAYAACVVRLCSDQIEMYAFAKEGLIKRDLAKKAISDVKGVLENGK